MSVVATLGILAIAAATILDLRSHIGAHATATAENLLHALERDIDRNVEVLDLSLQAVIEGLARPDVMSSGPDLRNMILFDRSATASNLGALVVFDREGILTIDAAGLVPRSIAPVTDRDYFQAQREAGRGLFISEPYRSRLIGEDVVGLSRRVSNPDGSFGGVVLATIEVSYFERLLGSLRLGPKAVVSIFRDDGRVLLWHSASGPLASGSIAGSPNFLRMSQANAGAFVAKSRADGVERLITFTRIGQLPLHLTVALATEDIYEEWLSKAFLTGAVLCAFCLVIVFLTAALQRELRQRAVVERELVVANDELALLSRTDALTGLGNRRSFDEVLAREGERAARTRSGLSLVLLDVDRFKAFNDRYGHLAGDAALGVVAGVLKECVRRPGDAAFRVGGEEFAVLLVGTELPGAMTFSHMIRKQLRAARMPHVGSPTGYLTVSLGIAEVRSEDLASTFARADAALYASKRDGRDRVTADGLKVAMVAGE